MIFKSHRLPLFASRLIREYCYFVSSFQTSSYVDQEIEVDIEDKQNVKTGCAER